MSFLADPLGNISGAISNVGKGIANATKNPLVDMAAAAALDYFTGGAAGVLGETGAMGSITGLGAAGNAALLTGGIAGLASGNLAQGLMAGLAGYTGASAGESLGMGGYGATPPATETVTPAASNAAPAGPTPTNPVDAPANVADKLAPNTNPAQGLRPNFTPTAADSPYSMASKTVTQMPNVSIVSDAASKLSPFSKAVNWFGEQSLPTQLALGAGAVYGLKSLATPQKLNAPTQPNTQFIRSYNYSPFGGYSFQGSTPAVGGGMAPGGLVALAKGGGVHHYDVGGDIAAAYQSGDIGTVNDLIAQNQLTQSDVGNMFPGFDLSTVNPNVSFFNPATAGSGNDGSDNGGFVPPTPTLTPTATQVGGDGITSVMPLINAAAATPANNTPAVVNNTPATNNTAPGITALNNTPAYTSYTPDQIAQFVQTSGINLNDPAAVAAAEKTSNIDPAVYQAWAASNANPFSAAYLTNPTNATATNIGNFDTSLGTNPANIDIGNAVHTAYANTGATSNLAGNIAGNTQIAQEMDTWHVPPSQMAAALKMDTATIQKLYDAVDPKGPYASPAAKTVTPTPTPTFTPSGTNTVTTPNGTVLNTYTPPGSNTPIVLNPVNRTTENVSTPTSIATAPAGALASGVGGMNALVNPNGTITQTATTPTAPGLKAIMDSYTQGGGSLGYTNPTYNSIAEFNAKNDTQTGGSKAAFDYLMGKSPYPPQPTGAPYQSSVLGQNLSPAYYAANPYIYDPTTKSYIANPKFDPAFSSSKDALGQAQTGITPQTASMLHYAQLPNGMYGYPNGDGTFTGIDGKKYDATGKDLTTTVKSSANGGLMSLAAGGMSVGHLGGYSDGGRLLRGPGDGVSDSIPATIGASDPEPARLADGEFVVPARIVSELGNGSTEAGARQLYKMMDRIQKARSKTVGKNAVATNTNAHQYLPA
jgi:hypothetical protein